MAPSTSSGERSAHPNRPSALACLECRKKHLKCDSTSPICSRCARHGLYCTYTPSRRGRRGGTLYDKANSTSLRRFGTSLTPSGDSFGSCEPVGALYGLQHARITQTTVPSAATITMQVEADGQNSGATLSPNIDPDLQQVSRQSSKISTLGSQDDEYLTNLFYTHFHSAHPFLLPQSRYRTSEYPTYLRIVVQLIGSHYASNRSCAGLVDAVDATLVMVTDSSVPLVQSLLLFAIVLHARLEMGKANLFLSRATEMAIKLGLNRADFPDVHGIQDPLVVESLRRTWWELYVIDGYFAGLHRKASFRCNSVELTTLLPCGDDAYVEGLPRLPTSSLEEFDQRFFSNEEREFSSAVYRISAIRILARAMSVMKRGDGASSEIQAIDHALSAWTSHLPEDKATVLYSSGNVDQMMLQAHSFINYIRILVHFPRSELLHQLPPMNNIVCLRRIDHTSPTCAQHANKAIAASKNLSDLADLPMYRHSPLFICCLVFGCIVQLSACAVHPHNCLVEHQERVALMTGVLKQIGNIWPLSQDVLRHLNNIASAVFKPREPVDKSAEQTPNDSAIDMNSMTDTLSWLDQVFAGDLNCAEGFTEGYWSEDFGLPG